MGQLPTQKTQKKYGKKCYLWKCTYSSQEFSDRGLPGSRRANDHNAHPLLQLFVELNTLLNLKRYQLNQRLKNYRKKTNPYCILSIQVNLKSCVHIVKNVQVALIRSSPLIFCIRLHTCSLLCTRPRESMDVSTAELIGSVVYSSLGTSANTNDKIFSNL